MLSFLEKFEKEFESSQKRIAQGLLILIILLQLVLSFGVFGICGHVFGFLACVFGNLIGCCVWYFKLCIWYLASFENEYESSQKQIAQGLLLSFPLTSTRNIFS